ncbi:MerR family transcriptional regulator [Streptomyces collinus]|uniref:MerR family transcriptional regulator n=1 Tax=Streptomyces collinus TaxID=42684 RepID=UPI0036C71E1C
MIIFSPQPEADGQECGRRCQRCALTWLEGQLKEDCVLIGELSRRTEVSERLLRYYERVELIRSERRANGYREYSEETVETVRQIRGLLAAGLPTRVIRQVLPCAVDGVTLRPCPGVLDHLRAQLDALDRRAADLATARDLLRETITETESAATPEHPRLRLSEGAPPPPASGK